MSKVQFEHKCLSTVMVTLFIGEEGSDNGPTSRNDFKL